MKLAPLILLPLFLPSPSPAQRLYSDQGTLSTNPGSAEAHIQPDAALAVNPATYANGTQLIASVVTYAERAVRKSPPASATNVQRELVATQKRQSLQSVLNHLPGQGISISFEVLDVVNRPPPKPPAPLPPDKSTLQSIHQYDLARKDYEHERAAYDRTRMMVIGRVNWSSPTVRSPDHRRAAASARASARPAPGAKLEDRKSAHEDLKQTLSSLRDQADDAKPAHLIYLLGSNPDFAQYKRGQTRSAKAVIQLAAAHVHLPSPPTTPDSADEPQDPNSTLLLEDLSSAYVAIDLALVATPDPAPQPR
jgi:hypothetical protein